MASPRQKSVLMPSPAQVCGLFLFSALIGTACRRAEMGKESSPRPQPFSSVARPTGAPHPPPAPSSVKSTPAAAPEAKPILDGGAAPAASAELPLPAQELTWALDDTPWGRIPVVISIPARATADQKFPVLVVFHGRGEALKGPDRGARGWIDDYGLYAAIAHLSRGELGRDDFGGIVTERRLQHFNQLLKERPYRGLIVACSYTPEPLGRRADFARLDPMADFVVDRLLPRLYRETPAFPSARKTGIDGVSLGGRVALLVGLKRALSFGTVGALQPAFDSSEAADVAALAATAVVQQPELVLRILSSDGDYFLEASRNISRQFRAARVAHEFIEVPGPHNYEFNRGPGVLELLLFHDRILNDPNSDRDGGSQEVHEDAQPPR